MVTVAEDACLKWLSLADGEICHPADLAACTVSVVFRLQMYDYPVNKSPSFSAKKMDKNMMGVMDCICE
ncbi:MAG: hypothetical protein MJZ41_05040 [Bacteroidaceae bacterium]|nr:hypothetical protein [Bacteroidaceae bacterium]